MHKSQMKEEIVKSEWFLTKPKSIQELILKYFPGSRFEEPKSGKIYYVIGYAEGYNEDAVGLKLTELNPIYFYNEAIADNFYVCLNCLNEGKLMECNHEQEPK